MNYIKLILLPAIVSCVLLPLLVLGEKPIAGSMSEIGQKGAPAEYKRLRNNGETSMDAYSRRLNAYSLGPYHLLVPPAAFTSDGANPDAFRIDSSWGYVHGLYGSSNLWAPLYLPSNAIIHSLEVRLVDQDAHPGHDVCVYLDRMNLETGEYECCLLEVCSYGESEEYVVLVENGASGLAVTDLYAYQLNIYGLYPETYIFGLRVGYGFQEHLPAIMSE